MTSGLSFARKSAEAATARTVRDDNQAEQRNPILAELTIDEASSFQAAARLSYAILGSTRTYKRSASKIPANVTKALIVKSAMSKGSPG